MAVRIPLVIVAGQVEQLQSGDQILVDSAGAEVRLLTNNESATTVTVGMSVYINAAAGFKRAQANALSTGAAIGIVRDVSVAPAAAGYIAVSGLVTATTTQWDAVAGTTGGLVFNTLYYVDPTTPGKITGTAPSTVSQVVAPIGRALSTTDLEVNIGTVILL